MNTSFSRIVFFGMCCFCTASLVAQPSIQSTESQRGSAQADCNDLSITAINTDAQNADVLQISIAFNAAQNVFINYPFIAALLDCDQDTVGSGDLFWFGQFGQSVQDYPVNITDASDCGPFTAYFVYGNDNGDLDTCALMFSFSASNNAEIISNAVFPNPFSDQLILRNENNAGNYQMLDGHGRVVRGEQLTDAQHKIDTESLPKGVYFIAISGEDRKWIKVVKQ